MSRDQIPGYHMSSKESKSQEQLAFRRALCAFHVYPQHLGPKPAVPFPVPLSQFS